MSTGENGTTKSNKRLQRGCLLLIGKNYYIKFTLNGKQFKRVLTDDTGKPITNRKEAEKAKEKLLSPYFIRNKQTLTENMLSAIKTDDDKLINAVKEADDILNPALTLDKAWNAYLVNQERPQGSSNDSRNFMNYSGYFHKFHNWFKKNKTGAIRLKDITQENASEYALHLKQTKISAGTFNKHVIFLSAMFRCLKKQAKLEINPFENIKRLHDSPNARRELTLEEIKTILERATGDLQLLFGLGVFTGLRLGDCCTLQWHETDLDERVIKRIPNKTARSKKSVIVGIPEVLYYKLIEIPVSQRKGYLMPLLAEKYYNSNNALITMIQKHFTDCGIQTQKQGTGQGTKKRAVLEVGFHSLRHSYISINARAGVSQSVLVKLAGHSQKMSELYTHVTSNDARLIADKYSSILKATESAISETITVESVPEPTEAEKRIVKALEYVRTAGITEADKQNLLNILEPVI